MKNEIGRKITSLTLMIIMVAGGMTFAVPGMIPAAHAANANLFVSAENPLFDNYFNGPQVIEIVIIDPDINDTDEGKGEPDVTVNGKDARMVQATDGNWYAYIADRSQAQLADSSVEVPGFGLDFGSFCDNTSTLSNAGAPAIVLTDTVGVAIPDDGTLGGVQGEAAIQGNPCSLIGGPTTTDTTPLGTILNVIRENKAINPFASGQIDLDPTAWPFIQLYNFNPTGNVIIQYNKGGGAQTTSLTFDTVDQYADLEKDRDRYPNNAEVHLLMTDVQLNIDPTDEDSWTWDAGTGATYYNLFNENGVSIGDGVLTSPPVALVGGVNVGGSDLTPLLGGFACEDNCIFLFNVDAQATGTPVITIDDNDDSGTTGTGTLAAILVATTGGTLPAGTNPVTFTELAPNQGQYSNYDEFDDANIITTAGALRGTSATVDYNETPVSIVIGFEFASIDIQPVDDVWNSGEEIPVVLVDGDANLNTRVDEDLDVFNTRQNIIPALQTGNPFVFDEATDFGFIDDFLIGPLIAGVTVVAHPVTAIVTAQNDFEFTTELGSVVGTPTKGDKDVQLFSARAVLNIGQGLPGLPLTVPLDVDLDCTCIISPLRSSVFVVDYNGRTLADLQNVVILPDDAFDVVAAAGSTFHGDSYFSFDYRTFNENPDTEPLADTPVVQELDFYLIVDDGTSGVPFDVDKLQLAAGPVLDDICLIELSLNADTQGQTRILDTFYEAIYDADSNCTGAAYTGAEEIGLLVFIDTFDTD